MKTPIASLKSISPYSQSRHIETPKNDKETPKDYEKRTWRERAHVNNDGYLFIPPMAFKNSLTDAAQYLSVPVPGKGKTTYTKNFVAGVLCVEPLVLPIKIEDVQHEWLFLPSDGKRGGGKRVDKCFPLIPSWEGDVQFVILDETITSAVFKYVLDQCGAFIGIGRFRPRNNGYYGRFKVTSFEWLSEDQP